MGAESAWEACWIPQPDGVLLDLSCSPTGPPRVAPADAADVAKLVSTKAAALDPSAVLDVDLGGNRLSDSGVQPIAAVLTRLGGRDGAPRCTMRKLDLRANDLTNGSCAAALGALLRSSAARKIEELSLRDNCLTEAAVREILLAVAEQAAPTARGAASALHVDLSGNFIEPDALQEQCKALLEDPAGNHEAWGGRLRPIGGGTRGRRVVLELGDQAWGDVSTPAAAQELRDLLTEVERATKARDQARDAASQQWHCATCGAAATRLVAPCGRLICEACANDVDVRSQIAEEYGPFSILKLFF